MFLQLFTKVKLYKNSKETKITEIHTPETDLYEEYNQKFEKTVTELLNKPSANYKLEIARLKQENQLDLIQKRIDLKRNEVLKKGLGITQRLELFALEQQYNRTEKSLEKLNSYKPKTEKKDRLSKLNDLLNEEKSKLPNTKSVISKNRLKIRIANLEHQRRATINKMVLNRDGISRSQNFLVAIDTTMDKLKERFMDFGESIETTESEKTR